MPSEDRADAGLLETLERMLALPSTDKRLAMSGAADLIAERMGADKVDVFAHDARRDTLVALGVSHQPLSMLERRLGLDVLPIANGGTSVDVFRTGARFVTGRLDLVEDELRGFKDALGVRSLIAVPLEIGGERRGVLVVSSGKENVYGEEDARFVEALARWLGVVVHRAELVETITRNAREQGRRAAADELVTVLAHDLRNVISPIDLRVQMLRMRAAAEGREDDVRDADLAIRGLGRLSALVSDMLDTARVDQGFFRIDVHPVQLEPIVRETAAALDTPHHSIEVRVAEDVRVGADEARLRQCLENLLANAIKHSPAGASVTVDVWRERRGDVWVARIDVMDEGTGVPVQLQPRIFERFVAGTERHHGLGLGLYIAKRIAEAHGGDIEVFSPPGRGACFVLTLPAIEG